MDHTKKFKIGDKVVIIINNQEAIIDAITPEGRMRLKLPDYTYRWVENFEINHIDEKKISIRDYKKFDYLG